MTVSKTFRYSKTRMSQDTLALRDGLQELMASGRLVLETEDIQNLVLTLFHKQAYTWRKSATWLLKTYFKWKFERRGNGYIYYSPFATEEHLKPYREKPKPRSHDPHRLQEQERAFFGHLPREEQRAELIKHAADRRHPIEAYIHRAAEKLGVVRGYKWPR